MSGARAGEDQPRARRRPGARRRQARALDRLPARSTSATGSSSSRRPRLRVEGFADDTLVRAALEALAERAGSSRRWRVRIEKQIPVAAGLGGGSSDAATALRLANDPLAGAAPARRAARARRPARRRRAVLPRRRARSSARATARARAARPAAGLLGRAPAPARRREAVDRRRLRRVRRARRRGGLGGAAARAARSRSPPSRAHATSRRCPRTTSRVAARRRAARARARSGPTSAVPARPLYGLFHHRAAATAAQQGAARASGAPGSRHQRGTVDACWATARTRSSTARARPAGSARHRYRIALWIAAIEGVVVVGDARPPSRDDRRARGDRGPRLGLTASPDERTSSPVRPPARLDLRGLAAARPARRRRLILLGALIVRRRSSRSSPSAPPAHAPRRIGVALGRSQVVRQRVLVPRSQVRILAPQPSSRTLMADELAAVVMAGGLGTRMRSATPKHLHPLLGRRIVDWVIEAARGSGRRARRRRRLAVDARAVRRASRSPCRSSRSAPATPSARRAPRSTASTGTCSSSTATSPRSPPDARGARRDAPPRARGRHHPLLRAGRRPRLRPGRPRRRRPPRPDRRGRRRHAGGARARRGQLRHLRLPRRAALAGARAAAAEQRAGRALPDRHDRPPRRRRRVRAPSTSRPTRSRSRASTRASSSPRPPPRCAIASTRRTCSPA